MVASHKIKTFCILAILFVMIVDTYAQNGNFHTVGVGETLSSIAKQYGISETDIKEANPKAAKVFYVGLKLLIPEAKVGDNIEKQAPKTSSENGEESIETRRTSSKQPVHGKITSKDSAKNKVQNKTMDLSSITISAGLTAGTDFSKLVGFNYGLFANVFVNGRLGAYLSLSTNFPFTSSADSDFILKFGPEYKYNISDDFSIGGALCYSLTMAKYISNKALISGVSIMPFACYSYKNLEFSLHVDAYFRNGHSGLRLAPYLGVGYAF